MVDVGCLFLQSGGDLDARSSVTDGGDAFAFGVEVGVPVRRMAEVALEFLDTRVGWKLPLVEVAVCRDDEVELKVVNCRCGEVGNIQTPFGIFRDPLCRVDFGLEPALRVDIEFSSERLPVVLDLIALSVFLRPVDFRRVC
jgi:hypothetical protein